MVKRGRNIGCTMKRRFELAIAIKKNHEAGMKPGKIANLFKISKQRVNYWLHHPIIQKRKRRTKLNRNEINQIIKWARDKPIHLFSAKKIMRKFNSLPRNKKEKNMNKKVSLSTINNTLNKYLSKPKPMRKVFFLCKKKKDLRLQFLTFMKENQISPDNIFFTDECIVNLSSYFGRNNKVRICKRTEKKLRNGDEKALAIVNKEFFKKTNGIMISGGICKEGLGRIIFHSGNVNSFAYRQVLNFYKEDLDKFPNKIFQQDGAKAHSSKSSRKEIEKLFGSSFIPTWNDGPKLNDKIIPRWPPSSPDLSSIELVWSIIKTMLNLFPPKSIYELKSSIQKIWESIPPIICSRIIEHIKKRWELCIKSRGRRLDKELLRKILPNKEQIKWKVKNSCIEGVRISYNDTFVLKLKDKDIKERAKKINEQLKNENKAKAKLDAILRLKPKDYKNLSKKEKEDIKFDYLHEKALRETMEEELEKIKKMKALEYLDILNIKTKEKLIGLCLDKHILESLDDSTNFGDDDDDSEGIEDNE